MGKSWKIGVGILANWIMYWHVPVLKTLEDTFEHIVILDPSQERADQATAENGFARDYSDIDELLADPDVDIVFVNTSGYFHYAHAKKVIEAKRTCTASSHSTRLSRRPRTCSTPLTPRACALSWACSAPGPATRCILDLIAGGYVGEINAVSLRVDIDGFSVPTYDRWKWYTAPDGFTTPSPSTLRGAAAVHHGTTR